MGSASSQRTAAALAQEADVVWIRESGIFPPAVVFEMVIHSPRPFTNPAPTWRAGKLWAYSALRRDAKPATDANGTTGYPRRIWFQIFDPRDVDLEPQAPEAGKVKTASITAGKISDPATVY